MLKNRTLLPMYEFWFRLNPHHYSNMNCLFEVEHTLLFENVEKCIRWML